MTNQVLTTKRIIDANHAKGNINYSNVDEDVIPLKTEAGDTRRVGVEIEFAGLMPTEIIAAIQGIFGGFVEAESPFCTKVKGGELGDFRIELDAKYLQKLGGEIAEARENSTDKLMHRIYDASLSLVSSLAETVVPWEIVTAPIAVTDIQKLQPLISDLRERGALGTRHSMQFAFGVHLNPELPDLKAPTILAYIRAFICLYDWLCEKEDLDFARRVTPYIDHYPAEYITKVCADDYSPSMDELIDDYITFNATRNRALDLLPLFRFIDESRISQLPDNSLINARPTLHYRLPNCEIDNPTWSLMNTWDRWCQVELLANNSSALASRCKAILEK